MSTHRLFTPTPPLEHADFVLDGSRAHYLGHVLRARPNDAVTLFDGSGKEYQARVTRVSRKQVGLSIAGSYTSATESNLQITLVQSVLRGERMDFCVQKATELGVHRIAPVFTERTVAKIPAARMPKRQEHWYNTAVSACEQSGRVRLPAIDRPRPLFDAVTTIHDKKIPLLLLDPWAQAQPMTALSPPQSTRVAVCIGPEGGFTEPELDFMRNLKARSTTFGPRVLRSETAGVVAVAACQMLWGDC